MLDSCTHMTTVGIKGLNPPPRMVGKTSSDGSFRLYVSPSLTYRVGQKNRGHFVVRPITLEILNRSLSNLAQIKVTSLWTSRQNLNQLWKIVMFSEWQWHFYNCKFWIGDHFLTSFQPTSLHCYFTFLLINDVRITTFTHQLLSRRTSTPEVWQCDCEYSSRSAKVSVAVLRTGYADAEVVVIQPGVKLDTMRRGAWQKLATRRQGEMWPLQIITAAGRRSLSHRQKHGNLQRENLQFTEPNILSTE